jgi:hypothetical protein
MPIEHRAKPGFDLVGVLVTLVIGRNEKNFFCCCDSASPVPLPITTQAANMIAAIDPFPAFMASFPPHTCGFFFADVIYPQRSRDQKGKQAVNQAICGARNISQ